MTGPSVARGSSGVATAPGARGDEVADGAAATASAPAARTVPVALGRMPVPRHVGLTTTVGIAHGLTLAHGAVGDSHALVNTDVAHGLRLAHAVEAVVQDPPSAEVSVS